jgi:hypothetical protein
MVSPSAGATAEPFALPSRDKSFDEDPQTSPQLGIPFLKSKRVTTIVRHAGMRFCEFRRRPTSQKAAVTAAATSSGRSSIMAQVKRKRLA